MNPIEKKINIKPAESPKENTTETPEYSEELRQQLSDHFLSLLQEAKKYVEENVGYIRGFVRDSTLEAYRGVMIFSRAVQMFSQDPRIPANDRIALRVHGDNLIPVGSMEILPGVNSYPMAIKAVISVLDKLMTKEVSAAIHTYAEKIFLPPAEDNAKHGREPFDGTLFKPGE